MRHIVSVSEFLRKAARELDPILDGKQIGASQFKEITVKMYRGLEKATLIPTGSGYTINPGRGDQGVLWFTHPWILRTIDPIEYARGHGDILLTYPLKCTRHYANRGTSTRSWNGLPDEIINKIDTYDNCRFNIEGIELPDGWFFSYKHEKFAICTKPLSITPDMLDPKPSI
jgi:hypothetical protein